MLDKITSLYEKYKEIILYGIFGVLTTVVNFVLYFVFTNVFGVNYLISNCIAWLGAVIFAFFTNKIYVFDAKNKEFKNVLKEFVLFTGSRAFSFFIETLLLFLGVELLKLNNGLVKVAVAVIVVILNYFFTKYVFKEDKINQKQKKNYNINNTMDDISDKRFYLSYTMIFILLCFIIYLPFILNEKMPIFISDGISQHYSSVLYLGQYIRSIIKNILLNHNLIIPMWDLHIGLGQDVLSTLNYYSIGDPLNIFYIFTPSKYTSVMYIFLIFFRLFLSGLSFSFFCFKMGETKKATLIGSICYTFCAYSLFAGIRHPFFLNPMIYLPFILIGVEKILRDEKPYLFMISIAITAISNFYFFYMLTLATIVYAFLKVLYIYRDKKIFLKKLLYYFFTFTKYYILSVLFISVLFVPILFGFFYCSRISNNVDINVLLYSLSYYWDLISNIFNVEHYNNYWQYFNMTIITILSCIAIFKFKDRKHIYLKNIFLLLCVMSLIPIFGYIINAGSYLTNRWNFIFTFVISFITVVTYSDIKSYIIKHKNKLSILILFLTVVSFSYYFYHEKLNFNRLFYFVFLFSISIILLFINKLKYINNNKVFYFILSLITIGQISIIGYNFNTPGTGNYISNYPSVKFFNSINNNNLNYLKEEDNGIYRVDVSDLSTKSIYRNNYGVINGVNGISSYYSLLNKNIVELSTEVGNIGQRNLSVLSDYNKRAGLNSLLGVKYYLTNKNTENIIPYGYKKYKGKIYYNTNTLPLFYTYSSYIDRSTYSSLDINKKEISMLQGVVLDRKKQFKNTKINFNDKVILNKEQIIASLRDKYRDNKNIEINDDKIILKKSNIKLNLDIKGLKNSEVYFISKSLGYNKKKLDTKFFPRNPSNTSLVIYIDRNKKNICNLYTEGNQFYSGKYDLLFNLGYNKDKTFNLTLHFLKEGEYSFSDLSVVCQPMDDYDKYINKLKEDKLNKFTIDGNYVEANITTKEDKIGVLAIPYSPGWKAYVNGKETEVLRANTAFMGIKLEKGNNSIVFKYSTPGLREGAIITLITILLTLLYVKCKKYRV